MAQQQSGNKEQCGKRDAQGAGFENIKKYAQKLYDRLLYNNPKPAGQDAAVREKARIGTAAFSEAALRLLAGVFAFLLARSPAAFGTYPLGLALMCASTRRTVAYSVGMLLGALSLGGDGFIYAGGAVIAFAVRLATSRWLFSPSADCGAPSAHKMTLALTDDERTAEKPRRRHKIFCEGIQLRMATACVTAFMISVYNIISGGYTYYDLFGAFFLMTVCPFAVFIYSGYFDAAAKNTPFYEAAIAGFLFSAVYSVRSVSVYGISLGIFITFLIALLVSKQGGAPRGGIIGLLCGLAVDVTYAPMFGIAGFAAGLLWNVSAFAASACACIIGLIWGGYVGGFNGLVRVLPELVGGSCLMWPLVQYKLIPKIVVFSNSQATREAEAEAKIAERRQESIAMRISALSDTFKSLSEVFFTLSDRMRRPGILDLKQLCDTACDKYCAKCSMQSLCWEREYGSTLDVINKLTAELHKSGRASRAAIPEYMAKRCYNIDQIIDEINLACARLIEKSVKNDKTEVFAIDYEAVSRILSESLEADKQEYEEDPALSGKLRRAVRGMDFGARSLAAYGKRKKYIIADGVDLRSTGAGAEDIRLAFEEICGGRLSAPRFDLEEDLITMTLNSVRRFTAKYAKATSVMGDGEINGDSINMFENREDYFYAMICDGMGSGREAALTSRICQLFVEKMLSSGNKKTATLDMLNSFIRSKSIECSATIDLLELDLIAGEACFVKSGAAPSYVRRDGNLFRIQSKTVPIGIMRALDAEQIRFDVKDGDVIVMLSDGITQSFEECVWLLDLLTNGWDDDLEQMAAKIIEEAGINCERSDDMTAGLIRITEGK